MCGRYATSLTPAALNAEFEIGVAHSFAEIEPNYNVAPTETMPVVVTRAARGDIGEHRELLSARWGLIPGWAKDASIGSRLINARSETVAEKPAFAKAFARRRALVPATGYFEWYQRSDGSKQPFFIRPKDGAVLAMAGLYEFWKDSASDTWVVSYTVLTTTAEDDLGQIHDRMPLLVERERYAEWLDPAPHDADELLRLLVPAAPGRLDAYPVSKAVGNVRNKGAELIEPLPAQ